MPNSSAVPTPVPTPDFTSLKCEIYWSGPFDYRTKHFIPNNDNNYLWFIIKSDSNPRPGDDLLLRFKLADFDIEGTVVKWHIILRGK